MTKEKQLCICAGDLWLSLIMLLLLPVNVAASATTCIEEVAIMGDNFGIKDTYSIAIEVDAYNRKFFEDFEDVLGYYLENYPGEPWPESVTDNIRLIQKNDKVYLKLYFDEGRPVPKFWKVIEKDGKERKRRIQDTESLNWKKIEGEIVFSIANIFIGREKTRAKKYYLCRKRNTCKRHN